MNRERLLALAAFLGTVPRTQFDYGHWVGTNWSGDESLSCGTTGCALGWATTMPEFRDLGLRLVKVGDASFVCLEKNIPAMVNGFDDLELSIAAAMEIFDLTKNEAEHLFIPSSEFCGNMSPSQGASPATVADHIRNFIRFAEYYTEVEVITYTYTTEVDIRLPRRRPQCITREDAVKLHALLGEALGL